MHFIAYSTKGLEFVSENEIKSKIIHSQIIEVSDKRVLFDANTFMSLSNLRTVDDIGILVQKNHNINQLNELISEINKIDFNNVISELNKYRPIAANNFSITSSLARVKNFTTSELIKALSEDFQSKYHWNFTEFDHTNFDIRIFINKDVCFVSVRLTPESLQHRKYKTLSKVGSLKPTVAAAMVYLATERKETLKIVDNFCGSGTILAEALLNGNEVCGGDTDPESVAITKKI